MRCGFGGISSPGCLCAAACAEAEEFVRLSPVAHAVHVAPLSPVAHAR